MKANLYGVISAKDASQILAWRDGGEKPDAIAGAVGVTAEAVTAFLEKTDAKAKPKRKTAAKTEGDED